MIALKIKDSYTGWRHCSVPNKPIYRHELSAARLQKLLKRKNGDIFGASITYQREVEGCAITVGRHLNELYPFIRVEKAEPQYSRSEV